MQCAVVTRLIEDDFFHWASPKKLKYGKPRLGESTLTQIVLDIPNVTQINFSVLRTLRGGTSEKTTPCIFSDSMDVKHQSWKDPDLKKGKGDLAQSKPRRAERIFVRCSIFSLFTQNIFYWMPLLDCIFSIGQSGTE